MQQYYEEFPSTQAVMSPSLKESSTYVTRSRRTALFKTEFVDKRIFELAKDDKTVYETLIANTRMNELVELTRKSYKYTIRCLSIKKSCPNLMDIILTYDQGIIILHEIPENLPKEIKTWEMSKLYFVRELLE